MATTTSQGLSVSASQPSAVSEVMGREKARQRDHDQVVEEDEPSP